MVQEQTFYQDSGVTITNARAIIHGQTFSMANITSVGAVIQKPKTLWPAVMLGLGGLVAIAGLVALLMGDNSMLTCTGIGIVIALVGGLILFTSKPTYVMVIGSASGERRALTSSDQEYVAKVVAAMNQAIVSRG